MPVLGGSLRRLAGLRGSDARWSPDGKKVLFAQGQSLYLAGKDGSEPHPLVDVSGPADWLRWSPDGKVIRFSLTNSKDNTTALWEVSADGTNLRPLLPGWNFPPRECCGDWTADGKYFLFHSTRGGVTTVWSLREKERFWRKTSHTPAPLTFGQMATGWPLPCPDRKSVV